MSEPQVIEIEPETDAGRMALVAALRRDWRPAPTTLPWTPAMQNVLLDVALQIEAEARGYVLADEGDLPI